MPHAHAELFAALTLGIACGEAAPPHVREAPDKAALFGDATLVPTREGEAARRELAGAGEIAATLRASGWLANVHVDVEDGEPVRVVIAGTRGAAAPARLDDEVRTLVAAVLARDDAQVVLAIAEPASAPATMPTRTVPLVLAALGLGASVALLLDRGWRRRRSRRRRSRS